MTSTSLAAAPISPLVVLRTALARRRVRAWLLLVPLVAAGFSVLALFPQAGWTPPAAAWWALPLLFLGSLFCELIDSSLGMGYGTTLAPLLLLAGFDVRLVVPAVLLSECATGLLAALLHHRDRNIDFARDPRARRVALLLLALTIAGAVLAMFVAHAVAGRTLTLIVGGIVLGVGVVIVLTRKRQLRFRPAHLVGIGAIAAFNKAISGGGYGPLVTASQVVSGLPAKHAVAITSLCEGLTCLVGLVIALALGQHMEWTLAAPLTLGALASVPIATLLVNRVPERAFRGIVGLITIVLGTLTLIRA